MKSVPVRGSLVVAALAALLAWGMGMSWVGGIMLVAGAVTITLVATAVGGYEESAGWDEIPPSVRGGGRMDVAFQTWRLTGAGNTLNPAELQAVRVHVTKALLARGLDPADVRDHPAIVELLGARVTALLFPVRGSLTWRRHDT